MNASKLISIIFVTLIIAILLGVAFGRDVLTERLYADTSPSPSEGEGRGEVSIPRATTRNYLPIIFLNSATAGGAWLLSGNAGTNPTTDFLGTTDNVSFTIRVSNTIAYRIVPAVDPFLGFAPNIIGGSSANTIAANLQGATIGGGGANGFGNVITGTAKYATISGGIQNLASGTRATIGGGLFNTASGPGTTIGGGEYNTESGEYATIGGGYNNTASAPYATIGGGANNTASATGAFVGGGGDDGSTTYPNRATANASAVVGGLGNSILVTGTYAFIGGGYNNTASGLVSTIPGGNQNKATASYTFAAGNRAKANHDGTFVWGDSTNADFASTANNQFLIRANGGVGVNTNNPISNSLTVKSQIISGGDTATSDPESFVSQGIRSGVSMDDRDGTSNRWVVYPNTGVFRIYRAGSGDVVTINSSGKVQADGGFSGQCLSNASNVFNANTTRSCNMDFAEAFQSVELTQPGDLVALVGKGVPSNAPTVRKSTNAYDELIIGVVSQNPGLVFDNGETHIAGDNSQLITNDKTVVALVGRVNVNVSVENGAIHIGDALTSSSQPGVAMKATHAGKIIGYAMEASDADGSVLALIQPGYYMPPNETVRTTNDSHADNITQLETRMNALEQMAQTNFIVGLLGGALLGIMVMLRRKN